MSEIACESVAGSTGAATGEVGTAEAALLTRTGRATGLPGAGVAGTEEALATGAAGAGAASAGASFVALGALGPEAVVE